MAHPVHNVYVEMNRFHYALHLFHGFQQLHGVLLAPSLLGVLVLDGDLMVGDELLGVGVEHEEAGAGRALGKTRWTGNHQSSWSLVVTGCGWSRKLQL